MAHRRWHRQLRHVVALFSMAIMVFAVGFGATPQAYAATGSIWTTNANGAPQDSNGYGLCDQVYLRGANLPTGETNLTITKLTPPPQHEVVDMAVYTDQSGAFGPVLVYTIPSNPAAMGTYHIAATVGSHTVAHDDFQVNANHCANVTTSSSTTVTVTPGTKVTDTATVTGGTGSPTPTGTVTFSLCGPLTSPEPCTSTLTGYTKEGTGTLNGSGVATSPSVTAPSTPGQYCWGASYGGDENYDSAQETSATNECFTVAAAEQLTPTVTTTSSSTTTVSPGATVTDKATVSGGTGNPTPTGTVTFTLCGPLSSAGPCTSGGIKEGTGSLNSSGVATSPSATAPSTPGQYCWGASYGGDNNYTSAQDTSATNECFTVASPTPEQLTPTVTTTASSAEVGVVDPGTAISDVAMVSGGTGNPAPTGTVTFTLCGPLSSAGPCTSGGVAEGTGTLKSNGYATSPSVSAPSTPGWYCWGATYGGDDTYASAQETTGTNECFIVASPTPPEQMTPTVTTNSSSTGTVAPGTAMTDSATVSGGVDTPTPTGSVTFTLCGPLNSAGPCTSGGVAEGTETLNGNGAATSQSISAPSTPGQYCWGASYGGDDNYTPAQETSATDECFTVASPTPPPPPPSVRVTPTVTTQSSATGNVKAGTAVTDTVIVAGAVGGVTPSGSVAFSLCGPLGSASTCTSGTPEGTVNLTNGSATSQSIAAPSTPGLYCWGANYGGDNTYNAAPEGNDTNECFTVSTIVVPPTPPHAGPNGSGSIWGQVTSCPGAAAGNATVTLSNGSSENVTADGYFKFAGLADGTYTVSAKEPGAKTVTKTVTVSASDESVQVNLSLGCPAQPINVPPTPPKSGTLPKTGTSPWPDAAGVFLIAGGIAMLFRRRRKGTTLS